MNKPPAYQRYVSDFMMDTLTWSNEEVGALDRLLDLSRILDGR